MDNNYVYITFDKIDFSVKYVGSGKGKRLEHVLSGRSSSVKANRAVLTHESEYETLLMFDGLSADLARKIESGLIFTLEPDWNSNGKIEQPDIGFDTFHKCLKARAFVNIVQMIYLRDKYDPEQFETCYYNFLIMTYVEEGTDILELSGRRVHGWVNAAVDYYLNNGSWPQATDTLDVKPYI